MFDQFDVVFSYSRAQAIADGVLVDVSQTAREAGFRISVALTSAAWSDAVEWTEADSSRTGEYQDQSGRLWDVVCLAYRAAKSVAHRAPETDRVAFTVLRIPRSGGNAQPLDLEMHIGGGDHHEPVATIMLPGED
jgi:hypothetical protein